MTVSTEIPKAFFTGDGSTVDFDFDFKYFTSSEIKVSVEGVAQSGYTVTPAPSGEGGTVTLTSAPTNAAEGVIYLEVPFSQTTRIPTVDRLSRGTLENALDRLTMLTKTLKDSVDRSFKIAFDQNVTPDTEITLVANKAVIVNADGDGITLSTDDYEDQLTDVTAQATAAAASASAASTSASAAATSASAAATSASSASTSATNAAASALQAESVAAGISSKNSCRVATTAALTATYSNGSSGVGATLTNSGSLAALTLDGVALSANDRVLVKDQSTAAQNGIYKVTTVGDGSTAWVLTRTTDYDTTSEVVEGSFCLVESGTVNSRTIWIMTTAGSITIGTTNIAFQLMAASSGTVTQVSSGGGLTGGPITGTGTLTVNTAVTGKTANYSIVSGDLGSMIVLTTNAATFTMPTAFSVGNGWCVWIKNGNATASGNNLTVNRSSSDLFNREGYDAAATSLTLTAGESCLLVSSGGSSWHVLGGSPIADYSHRGDVRLCTGTEAYIGTEASKVMTPATLHQGVGYKKVSYGTASAAATIDFTTAAWFSSSYDFIDFLIWDIAWGTDNIVPWLRVSTDGGSSWKSGAADYNYGGATQYGAGAFGSAGDTKIPLTTTAAGGPVGNVAIEQGGMIAARLLNPSNASLYKSLEFRHSFCRAADGVPEIAIGHGKYIGATTAVNGLRLTNSGGATITAKYAVYLGRNS